MKRPATSLHLPRVARLPLVSAAVIAFAVSFFISGCGGASTGVPDLTGMTLAQAQEAADDNGLQLTEGERLPSFLPADTVLSQDPLPGTSPSGDTVQVAVSREPIPVGVRDVRAYDVAGDGRENDAQLPNLYDGDFSTSWSTEQTYKSPDFLGLGDKVGVGFSFWLDEGATMLRISYTMTGWQGEVQKIVNEMPIALAQLGQNQLVSWAQPISSGRIWFTYLSPLPDSDRYGAIINEIEFYR